MQPSLICIKLRANGGWTYLPFVINGQRCTGRSTLRESRKKPLNILSSGPWTLPCPPPDPEPASFTVLSRRRTEVIKQIHTFTSSMLFWQRRFGLGCPSLYQVKMTWSFWSQNDLIKAGATQTETSLPKQHAAGERVDLLDDYDFPARTITETNGGVNSDGHSVMVTESHGTAG